MLNPSQARSGAFVSLSHHIPKLDSIFQAQGMGAAAFVFPGRATSPSWWRYLIVIKKASDVTISGAAPLRSSPALVYCTRCMISNEPADGP